MDFVTQFESDVYQEYVRMGSRLRYTVRAKTGVRKGTTGFADIKNLYNSIECDLLDYYAGDWVDNIDELKTNEVERKIVASAGAYALGRKTDELIVDAMKGTKNEVGDYTTGLTIDLICSALGVLNEKDVPDDGFRFAVVGKNQWEELLAIKEFASADESLSPAGILAKKWLGVYWILYNNLPINGNNRDCFIYHRNGIAHACGADVKTDITWYKERASHFIINSMTQGAVLTDGDSVVRVKCLENIKEN